MNKNSLFTALNFVVPSSIADDSALAVVPTTRNGTNSSQIITLPLDTDVDGLIKEGGAEFRSAHRHRHVGGQ
jgi:hypothetical protein